jgi:hypothetical protein
MSLLGLQAPGQQMGSKQLKRLRSTMRVAPERPEKAA